MTLLLLLGCASLDWDDARAGCGVTTLSGAAWPAASTDEWAELTLDRACIDTLQAALNLESVPPGVADSGSLEASGLTQAQAGLWMFLAFELGTLGEMRVDPHIPEVLAHDLDRLELPDETPGGEALYTLVTRAIAVTRVRESDTLALVPFTDTLLVPSRATDSLPFGWADGLVHEAVHAPGGRGHVDCESGVVANGATQDDDWNSAWGAGIWTLHWFRLHADPALLPVLDDEESFGRISGFCEDTELPDGL